MARIKGLRKINRYTAEFKLKAVTAVSKYIRRYNRHRLHSSLAYQSPIDYERRAA